MQQAAEIVLGGLVQGGVFALLALGLSLVFRGTGVVNLAQGGFADSAPPYPVPVNGEGRSHTSRNPPDCLRHSEA